eukprot:3445581-Amphidinium_carterae.1
MKKVCYKYFAGRNELRRQRKKQKIEEDKRKGDSIRRALLRRRPTEQEERSRRTRSSSIEYTESEAFITISVISRIRKYRTTETDKASTNISESASGQHDAVQEGAINTFITTTQPTIMT